MYNVEDERSLFKLLAGEYQCLYWSMPLTCETNHLLS